jgi:F-type H+-transporting ATPase subunit b
MKRFTLSTALILGLAATGVWAQEPKAEHAGHAANAEGEEGGMELWAWLNFALLAGGLVWVFRKNAGPYFVSRAIGIRKGMLEADDARAEAERKIASVETRLANLPADIQALKNEALAQEEAAHQRALQETAAELAKIRAHAEQEIVSAGKAARMDLKRYMVELAIGAAEQKIRARIDPAAEDALLHGFLRNLSQGSPAQRT